MEQEDAQAAKGSRRPWYRKPALSCLGCALVLFLVVALLFEVRTYRRTWSPWLDYGPDYGPYTGTAAEVPADRPANQVFPIYGDLQLEVYDRLSHEPAPRVLLRNTEDEVLWCIYAVPRPTDNPNLGDDRSLFVTHLRFERYRRFPYSRPPVIGVVNWVFGWEATWWFIDREGNLDSFWYSW